MNRLTLKALLSFIAIVAILVAVLMPVPAQAADRGPQIQTTYVTTNSPTVALPISDTGRFTPTWLLVTPPSGCTSAVYYVVGGITGTLTAATAGGIIAATNIPTMFYGDSFRVVPDSSTNNTALSTNRITVRAIGNVWD
jgi:hypothetical protein